MKHQFEPVAGSSLCVLCQKEKSHPIHQSSPMLPAIQKIEMITAALQDLGKAAKTIGDGLSKLVNHLDTITHSHTAFSNFLELVHAPGYFPSLRKAPEDYNKEESVYMGGGRMITMEQFYAELNLLAICYDMAQEARGDARRAFRS